MSDEKLDILIVDDQKAICYSLERFFLIEGYSAVSTQDVVKAMEILKTQRPGVVIMDIRMPGQNGLEVLTVIKEYHPNIQVIMMTAYSRNNSATDCRAFSTLNKSMERYISRCSYSTYMSNRHAQLLRHGLMSRISKYPWRCQFFTRPSQENLGKRRWQPTSLS